MEGFSRVYRDLIVNHSRKAMDRNLHKEKLRISGSVDIALECISEGVPGLVDCSAVDVIGKQLYKL